LPAPRSKAQLRTASQKAGKLAAPLHKLSPQMQFDALLLATNLAQARRKARMQSSTRSTWNPPKALLPQ